MGVLEDIATSSSVAIDDFGYNIATRTLMINFRRGGRYTYLSVPLSIYNANIRNDFEFIRG